MPEQTIYVTTASGTLNSTQKAKLAELGLNITVSSHSGSHRGQFSGDSLDKIRALDFVSSAKDEQTVIRESAHSRFSGPMDSWSGGGPRQSQRTRQEVEEAEE